MPYGQVKDHEGRLWLVLWLVYDNGAQRPAREPHPARDGSSCGPRCPTRKVNILSPDI